MRYTLSLLLCALAVASVSSQSNSSDSIIVAKGILEGIIATQGYSDVTKCMTGYDAVTTGLADAINTFYQVNATTTPAAIKLGKALKLVPEALRSCNNSIRLAKNLVTTMTSFASLTDYIRIIGNNLRTYGIDLVKEGYQANQAHNQSRLRDFGIKVGQAMAQVFLNGTGKSLPRPDANTTSKYMLISQGFVEGFSTGLKWDRVKPCMKDTTDIQNDMNLAILFLRSGDSQTFAQGIAALGSVLIDIPTAIQDCTGANDKAMDLFYALLAIQDFDAFSQLVQYNAAVNVIDIYDAISTAAVDLEVGAYKDFGTNTGIAIAKLFFDNVKTMKK